MMGKAKADPNPPETDALIANTALPLKVHQIRGTHLNLWCDHCNRSRHTRETCWKLHGKPTHLKNGKPGPRFVLTAHEKKSLSNQDQVEELIRLLKSSSLSGIPNASLAQTSNFSIHTSLSCTSNMYALWIIDSGASDHMTNLSSLF
ncbi:unnamed protein product [Vicia faba]|uniref:Uncharacterized protein n=1 Tax=Vicia faba TaxID=3906 RepID=A0AAV1APE3_VICFA|nr:unnamed protein product [Vicia faba]